MGRRRDPPDIQAAKGFPGKRRTKVERQQAEAEALAALLAAAPAESADPLAPPALLYDPRLLPALTIWREYTPRLSKLNLFGVLDRHTFAIFCVYYADFVRAQRDILERGEYFISRTYGGTGDKRPFDNPSVSRRDTAVKFILEFAKRFGLTPLDQLELIGKQASGLGGGLFGDRDPERPSDRSDPPAAHADGLIGVTDRFDTVPPGRLQ